MKKVYVCFAALAVWASCISLAFAQSPTPTPSPDSLSTKSEILDQITVRAVRASDVSPFAFSNVSATQLKTNTSARNLPSLLDQQSSLVSYSEDGVGVGYSSFRIRGVDATRINVTLNGMPLNNPESQGVYWVNLPNLSSSLQSIQIQRGLGTSSNGSAAMGASVSMKTNTASTIPYAEASSAWGSYNTFVSSVAMGTGLIKHRWSVDARYSKVLSDGYIRNGKVDHTSVAANLSYYAKDMLLQLNYINGEQHTGITWEGIDADHLASDRRYNPAGEHTDEAGNKLYYDNETDNYYSNIVQALLVKQFNERWSLNGSLNYNSGYGYYENYKSDRKFSNYGLAPQTINEVAYSKSDMITQKSMRNDFYVANVNANYQSRLWQIASGTSFSYYDGNHYGDLIWIKFRQNIPSNYEWYRNKGLKKEWNGFLKSTYSLIPQVAKRGVGLQLLAEMQHRYISYQFKGVDDDLVNIDNTNTYRFWNPKVGMNLLVDDKHHFYAFAGMANREPLRTDLKESLKGQSNSSKPSIQSERMFDYELGYKYRTPLVQTSVNLYYMNYIDQMVQTGKLNDVGYKLMENIPHSYRTGVELEGSFQLHRSILLNTNLTISKSRLKDYVAYYDIKNDDWETIGQDRVEHGATHSSFSPEVIGAGSIKATILPDLFLDLQTKYVGKQYYDNTSNADNRLADYWVCNVIGNYQCKIPNVGNIAFQIAVNNLFNKLFVANAWVETVHLENGSSTRYKGFYPQAPINVMGKIVLSF